MSDLYHELFRELSRTFKVLPTGMIARGKSSKDMTGELQQTAIDTLVSSGKASLMTATFKEDVVAGFRAFYRDITMQRDMSIIEDVRELLLKQLDFYGFTYNVAEGFFVSKEGRNIGVDDINPYLIKGTYEYNQNIPIAPDGIVRNELLIYIDEFREESIGNLKKALTHSSMAGDPIPLLMELFKAMNVPHQIEENGMVFRGYRNLSAHVFAHWMWCVKRYVYNKEVKYQIMPSIKRVQGAGKSYFVKKLSEPMNDYFTTAFLTEASDQRFFKKWTSHFIILFDELTQEGTLNKKIRLSEAEVNNLKKLLTEDIITGRPMGTNAHVKQRRTFMPIATSNTNLAKVIGDRTGARRYFELVTESERGCHYDFPAMNSIDLMLLWQGIDENNDNGYCTPYHKDLYSQLEAIQNTYVPRDTIDMFIEESGVEIAFAGEEDLDDYIRVSSKDLYEKYKEFMKDIGINSHFEKTLISFKEDIRDKGLYQEVYKREEKKAGRDYSIEMIYFYIKPEYAAVKDEKKEVEC